MLMKFLSKIMMLVVVFSLCAGGAAFAAAPDKIPTHKAMASIYEEEPNDTEDMADEFSLDDLVYGSFSDAEDQDNFVITVDEEGTLELAGLCGEGGSLSKYFTIGVYDSEGNNLDWSSTESEEGKDIQFVSVDVTPGDYYITVMTWDDDSNDYTDEVVDENYVFSASMSGFESEEPQVPVESVSLAREEVTLDDGDTIEMTATVMPENATDTDVTWVSADTSIAKVDEDGMITAINPGTTTVTARTVDGGFTASVTVTVNPVRVTGVSLNKTSLVLTAKRSEQLKAVIDPVNATNKAVTWKSSNSSIVKVTANGTVIGVAPGTAKVTVTTQDGGFTAACNVTVAVPVTGLKLNMSTKTLKIGQRVKLTAQVIPANAYDKRVVWSTVNRAVAIVDQTGTVTAKGRGTTMIYAKTPDGRFAASCKITVTK